MIPLQVKIKIYTLLIKQREITKNKIKQIKTLNDLQTENLYARVSNTSINVNVQHETYINLIQIINVIGMYIEESTSQLNYMNTI